MAVFAVALGYLVNDGLDGGLELKRQVDWVVFIADQPNQLFATLELNDKMGATWSEPCLGCSQDSTRLDDRQLQQFVASCFLKNFSLDYSIYLNFVPA